MIRLRFVVLAGALVSGLPSAGGAQANSIEGVGVTKGDSTAPITVTEFGDFGCSACALFALETFPTIHEEFVQTGRVRWRFIPFVLGPFRHSQLGARAALCAHEQDAFWPMHDALYAQRDAWMRTREPRGAFITLAQSLGIDGTRFETCYDGEDAKEQVNDLTKLARRMRVRATPTFLIEDQRVLGALPAVDFRTILEQALQQRSNTGRVP